MDGHARPQRLRQQAVALAAIRSTDTSEASKPVLRIASTRQAMRPYRSTSVMRMPWYLAQSECMSRPSALWSRKPNSPE